MKELLQLAAKAIGERLHFDTAGIAYFIHNNNVSKKWAPHEDDGDAFRLQVKLRMSLDVSEQDQMALAYGVGLVQGHAVDFDGDPERATRLAILEVAAAVGRAMP